MNQRQAAYQTYLEKFSGQSEPDVYGGYGKDIAEIAQLPRAPIVSRDVMDNGACMAAYILRDGRAVEERQTEYGQARLYVFSSAAAYQSYIKPMSLYQYHE